MGKLFGTDGIRGIANIDLSPELAYKIGRAAGYMLSGQEKKTIVIGKDTRQSCDMLEAALAAGITSCGLDVIRLGVIPTPAVAFLTRHYGAVAGVVISASHNPGEYNGIKFFGGEGYKLPDAVEDEIENYILSIEMVDRRPMGAEVGRISRVHDSERLYIDFLKTGLDLDLTGYKIALDCGNGATCSVAPQLFKELGAEVHAINTEPDGMNINRRCGSTWPEVISEYVKEIGADMGFAYDGDGDRLIAVDETGTVMDGDHVMAACAGYMKRKGQLTNNAVVGTVMTNIGLFEYLSGEQIRLETTDVGDRYVLERMKEKDYALGGEQSGHIIFLHDNTTGDGTLSSLKLAQIVVEDKTNLSTLNRLMVTYPQVLVNARVKKENKTRYQEDPEIAKAIQEITDKFNGEGRVLIRPSGTEPLVRVMIEGKDQDILVAEANALAHLIETRLG